MIKKLITSQILILFFCGNLLAAEVVNVGGYVFPPFIEKDEKVEKNEKLPNISTFIDTKLLFKNKKGNAIAQAISIFSIVEIEMNNKDRVRFLEWANTWNGNILPIRIQVGKNKIVAVYNLITTKLKGDIVCESKLDVGTTFTITMHL